MIKKKKREKFIKIPYTQKRNELTLKMRFLLVSSHANPPRKPRHQTSTIIAATMATACATNVIGRAFTPIAISLLLLLLLLWEAEEKLLTELPKSLALYLFLWLRMLSCCFCTNYFTWLRPLDGDLCFILGRCHVDFANYWAGYSHSTASCLFLCLIS